MGSVSLATPGVGRVSGKLPSSPVSVTGLRAMKAQSHETRAMAMCLVARVTLSTWMVGEKQNLKRNQQLVCGGVIGMGQPVGSTQRKRGFWTS